MGILRWMGSKTRKERIRYHNIQENLVVASIVDKLRDARLRWFKHLKHRPTTALMGKIFSMPVDGTSKGEIDESNMERIEEV